MSFVYHLYVIRMYSYVTRMSFVCHSYIFVCSPCVTRMYSYVTRMYSYVTRMSLVCTRISPVCHLYVLVCHLYATRLWFYDKPFISSISTSSAKFSEFDSVNVILFQIEVFGGNIKRDYASKVFCKSNCAP